jgi:hypothetical protein
MQKFIILCSAAFLAALSAGIFALNGFVRREKRADLPADLAAGIAGKSGLIAVEEPRPLSAVVPPLIVRGRARGNWFFEGSFPIMLADRDGRIIAESHASAVLDPDNPESTWMTAEFVPFEGKIEFQSPVFPDADKEHFSRRGTLILRKDNPSGLPEHDDALEIPVYYDL